MLVKNTKELFLLMLSDVRYGAEIAKNFYLDLAKLVEDADLCEAVEARLFVSVKNIVTLEKCFEMVGEKPIKVSGRVYDAFVEDFRRRFAEIQAPSARRVFILAEINRLIHLRIGEYVGLIALADSMGRHGISVLLESCLADKFTFIDRTRLFILGQVRDAARAAAA
jgi:ferritin-like metal-binding protein YciE